MAAIFTHSAEQSWQNGGTPVQRRAHDKETKRLTSDVNYGSLGGSPDVTAAAPSAHTTDGMCLIKSLTIAHIL